MECPILIRGAGIMFGHHGWLAMVAVFGAAGFAVADDPTMPYYRVHYHVEADERLWNGMRSYYREVGKLQEIHGGENVGQGVFAGPMEYVAGPRGMTRFSARELTVPLNIELDPDRIDPRTLNIIFDGENTINVMANYYGNSTEPQYAVSLQPGDPSERGIHDEVLFPFLAGMDIDREGFDAITSTEFAREEEQYRETLDIDPEIGMPVRYTRTYTGSSMTSERTFADYKEVAPGQFLPYRAEFTVWYDDRILRTKKMTVQSIEALDEEGALQALIFETGAERMGGLNYVSNAVIRYRDGTVNPVDFTKRLELE